MVGRSAEKEGEGVDRATKHLCSVRPECTHMRCGLYFFFLLELEDHIYSMGERGCFLVVSCIGCLRYCDYDI